MIRPGELERLFGDVDVDDRRRAACGCINTEGSAVGEEVQHARAAGQCPRQPAVLALVEKEPRLLPLGRLDHETQRRLADRRGRIAGAVPFALQRQLLEPARREVVLEIDQPRCGGVLQRLDEERPQLLEAVVRDLDDEDVVVAVDNQAAEVIPFGVQQPAGIRRRVEEDLPPPDGRGDALPQQLRGQRNASERQRAQADL